MRRIRLTACVLAIAGIVSWVSPSQAYRMISPSSSGRGYGGSLEPVCEAPNGFAYWASSNIPWIHSTAGTGAGKAAALQSAMNAWTNVANAGHVLTYAGTTSTLPNFSVNDGTNTVSWEINNSFFCSSCICPSCLALTAINVQSTAFGKRILESDILFNDAFSWNTSGSPASGSPYDVQTVATHELGHALGIHHTQVTTTPRPTMYASYFDTGGRTLEADDRDALVCSDARYLNPALYGSHNVTSCREISGVAGNSRLPNLNTRVEIRDGSTLLAQIPADGPGHGFLYTPSSSLKNGQYHTINVRQQWNGVPLTDTGDSLICRVPVFTTQTPAEFLVDSLGRSWSVGNDFRSSIPGYITHLRYYRAAEETGVHTLKLWTLSGTPLGFRTFDFGSDLTAGWETSPAFPGDGIPIQANQTYVVTVTTFTKQSKTYCGLSSAISNGPLTATGGRWVEGNDIFPTNNSCSNYWTDVYFDQ